MKFSLSQSLLAPIFLVTGASLVVAITTHIPLYINLIIFGALTLTIFIIAWKKTDLDKKKHIKKRIKVGFLVGILATIAYDLSRYLLVKILPFSVWPFEALPLFGELLVGKWLDGTWILIAGISYHVINGIFFSIAYSILFGTKGWKFGIAWGIALEAAMVGIYPGWLDIRVLDEFLSMSLTGHIFYGWVLGFGCQKLLLKENDH